MIFSTHPLHPDVTARLQAIGIYVVASAPTAQAIMAEGLGAEVIIVRTNIPPEYFAQAPALRAAVRHGAGLDMVPMQAATDAGVLVANVPGVNAKTVAEHAVFAAIALRRQVRAVDMALRSKGWAAGRAFADQARELDGAVVGIVGMGNIGHHLTRIVQQGFGLQVISATPRPDSLPPGVLPVSMDDLAAQADIIVMCCPLTDATRGLMSAARIASMRAGAVLINVARGPVVDTAALIDALRLGHIGGAALDVFDVQPLPSDSPLWDLPNVILTPHMAGITEQSMWRMGQGSADETIRILANELPLNFCNPWVEAAYRKRFPA